MSRGAQNPVVAQASWPFARGVWFLDLQTSGTSPTGDHIIEIAWTGLLNLTDLPRDGSTPSPFTTEIATHIIRPPDALLADRKRLNRIRRLTGLSADQLAEGTSLTAVWLKIGKTIKDTSAPCLIHYAQFERSFLNQLTGTAHFPYPIVCTHALARHAFPNLPSKSLRAVAGHLHHTVPELKRASSHLKASMWVGAAVLDHFTRLGVVDLEGLGTYLTKNRSVAQGRTLTGTQIERSTRLSLPTKPGVYRFIGPQNTTLYVGKASSLKSRVNSYFRGRRTKGSRLHEMLSQAKALGTLTVVHPVLAALIEAEFIKLLDPPYNRAQRAAERSVAYLCLDALSPLRSYVSERLHDTSGSATAVYGPYPNRTRLEFDVALVSSCFFNKPDNRQTELLTKQGLPFSAPTLLAARSLLFAEWEIRDDEWAIRPLATLAGAARRLLATRIFATKAEGQAEETNDQNEKAKCSAEVTEGFTKDTAQRPRAADSLPTEDTVDSPELCAARVRASLRGLLRGALRGKRLKDLQNCTIALCSTAPDCNERCASKALNTDPLDPQALMFQITDGLLNPKGVLDGEARIYDGVSLISACHDPIEGALDPIMSAWIRLRSEASQKREAASTELLRHDLVSTLMAELKRMCNRSLDTQKGRMQNETNKGARTAWIRTSARSQKWTPAERFLYPLSNYSRSNLQSRDPEMFETTPELKTTGSIVLQMPSDGCEK